MAGGLDHSARVWDPDSGSCIAVLKVGADLIGQLHRPSVLIGADNSGKMHMWSLDKYNELQTIEAHDNSVTSMLCAGSTIVSGGADGKVKVWNMSNGDILQELASSAAVWKLPIEPKDCCCVLEKQ